jgi:hypothetical protein
MGNLSLGVCEMLYRKKFGTTTAEELEIQS